MDILIKNMEMPKSCEECPLFFEYYNPIEKKNIFHCRARWEGETRFADDFDWTTKPTHEEGCPLIPVPEHNDLADKSVIIERMGEVYEALYDKVDKKVLSECHVSFLRAVMSAPVVIPFNDGQRREQHDNNGYIFP